MPESSLGVASSAGICFPKAGRQAVCSEAGGLGAKGEEERTHN